jgi:phage terminase small subunit
LTAPVFELVDSPEARKPLNGREANLLYHYLPGCPCDPPCQFNGTRAAIAAGYSARTARSIASRKLKQVNIQTAIARKMLKLELSTDRVLLEIARMALVDPAAFYEADGVTLKNIHSMDPAARRAIAQLEMTADGISKLRLQNKVESARLLANVLDMIKQRISLDGQLDLSVIQEVLRRANGQAEPKE